MITIVDYGLGNIRAFINIYKRLNIAIKVAHTAEELADAERIILPGVGAFDWAMSLLNQSGMRDCLDNLAKIEKRPVLGVCVGMQMMAKHSEEGALPGLGWIDAEVKKFTAINEDYDLRLPHMGWNDVIVRKSTPLFSGLETGARFYFLHSYYFQPKNPECILTYTEYHGKFASAVEQENMFGVQFHPEKSHQWGIHLLKNFGEV